jgi:hypothetical protein
MKGENIETVDNSVDVVVGLATMPREILDTVTGSITRIRDMGAWSIATGLPTKDRHLDAIEIENIPTEDVLKAGAPLAAVQPLFASRQIEHSPTLAAASALGGRLDVYRHVMRDTFVDPHLSRAIGAILPALIRRGLLDIADAVVTSCLSGVGISHHDRFDALVEALQGSHVALARKIHDPASHRNRDGSCLCENIVLPRILGFDLPIALATLEDIGCETVKRAGRPLFARAIEAGALGVAKQLAGRRLDHAASLVSLAASVLTAASKGYVDILAWLYKECHYEMSPEVLGAAARGGHLGVLEWAAHADDDRPIASWNTRYIAYAALAGDRPEPIIEWLLMRQTDRRDLSVGVAKTALARHGVVIPLLLHQNGIVPFDTWNALEVAVDKRSTYSAQVVLANGGRCDLGVLARCLARCDDGMIALLAGHYTRVDIQTVLDSGPIDMCSWAPIAWLVDNVPGLCVRDAHAIFTAPLSMGPYPDPCVCAQCHRPAVAAKK